MISTFNAGAEAGLSPCRENDAERFLNDGMARTARDIAALPAWQPGYGHISQQALAQTDFLHEHGYCTHVLYNATSEQLRKRQEEETAAVFQQPADTSPLPEYWLTQAYQEALNQQQVDNIYNIYTHTHTNSHM
jgi:hypothetical protein